MQSAASVSLSEPNGRPDEGYPRPMLRRDGWVCLNGSWEFALDAPAAWTAPEQVVWSDRIRVPFAPETAASGIANTAFYRACWYRRTFEVAPPAEPGAAVILHFGAVDYHATVWINGRLAVRHEGGYTPFEADITDLLRAEGAQTVVVRAANVPAAGCWCSTRSGTSTIRSC